MPGAAIAGAVTALACGPPPADGGDETPLPGAAPTPPSGYALFEGWSFHRDAAGFGIAVPDGWRYHRVGETACFRDPDGVRVLSVDPSRRPATDPLQGCMSEERRLSAHLPAYRRVRIESTPRFLDAAEWEYTYSGPGRMHARTIWVVSTPRHAYAIGWTTREFDWPANQNNLDMIIASFTPAGAA
jgi:hypothetical protein